MVFFKEYQQNPISLIQIELKASNRKLCYAAYLFLKMVGLCQQAKI
jgi:hypothetical protein